MPTKTQQKTQAGFLEHLNLTVSNSQKTAEMLCNLFNWKIRWSGPSIDNGTSVHVGSEEGYLALYTPPASPTESEMPRRSLKGELNHVGVVVDDMDDVEKRVISAGYTPYAHADYEPGRRFYFRDSDDIEYEVVSYT